MKEGREKQEEGGRETRGKARNQALERNTQPAESKEWRRKQMKKADFKK